MLTRRQIIPRPNPRGRSAFPGTRNPNKPVDTSVASLFDTAYAHPMLQRSPLLWLAYDLWVRKMHWCIGGTEEGPDQWVGAMRKERKHLDSCKSLFFFLFPSPLLSTQFSFKRSRVVVLGAC